MNTQKTNRQLQTTLKYAVSIVAIFVLMIGLAVTAMASGTAAAAAPAAGQTTNLAVAYRAQPNPLDSGTMALIGGADRSWSLVSLVVALFGGLFSCGILSSLFKNKSDFSRTVQIAQFATTILGVGMLLAFLAFVNFNLPMVLINRTTILFVICLFVQIGTLTTATLTKRQEEANDWK